jgi:hypothetical protein
VMRSSVGRDDGGEGVYVGVVCSRPGCRGGAVGVGVGGGGVGCCGGVAWTGEVGC